MKKNVAASKAVPKKTLLVQAMLWALLLVVTGYSASGLGPSQDPEGVWVAHSSVPGCTNNTVCAEWISQGHPKNGTLCCISQLNMNSNSFSACIEELPAARPDGANHL